MTIIIDSPPELTEYFASSSSQGCVYGAFDGLVVVGWHPDKKKALKLFCGVELVKIYKSMKG